MAMRMVSKTMNPGSNPGSPAEGPRSADGYRFALPRTDVIAFHAGLGW